MWNFLQESFTLGDEHRKMILKNRINFLKFNINDDIHIFLATLQNMLDELEIIDSDISDNTKVGILNRALPENLRWINVFQFNNNWKECCNYLKRIVPDITFSHLKEKKIQEEKSESIFHLHSYPKSKIRDKKRKYSKRKNGKCFLCGKYGHYIKDCFKNKKISFNKVTKNNKSNKDKRESDKKYNKNKINNKHVYLINNNKEYKDNYQEDFSKDYFSDNALEINSIETNNNYNKINEIKNNNFIVWILDSGASISTTNNINLLTNIKKCNTKISLANGKKILSNYYGDFTGFINNYKFTLKNIYYSKHIKKNLISINQLIAQNFKVIFNNYNNSPQALIYNDKGNRIYKSISDNMNTFKIFTSEQPIYFKKNNIKSNHVINHTFLNKSQLMDLWHRRLGHFDISKIKDKLNNTNVQTKCAICINSKLKNKSYKPTTNKTK